MKAREQLNHDFDTFAEDFEATLDVKFSRTFRLASRLLDAIEEAREEAQRLKDLGRPMDKLLSVLERALEVDQG